MLMLVCAGRSVVPCREETFGCPWQAAAISGNLNGLTAGHLADEGVRARTASLRSSRACRLRRHPETMKMVAGPSWRSGSSAATND